MWFCKLESDQGPTNQIETDPPKAHAPNGIRIRAAKGRKRCHLDPTASVKTGITNDAATDLEPWQYLFERTKQAEACSENSNIDRWIVQW